ncbi:hypothetical protein PILCRDRAFT_16352 [Piloderma croceum F 1598]|uniref:Uncharacterized protein n=1 Tax=Piloderma croceum (strain F 1598) TaxID=765440 RepID=A0A0C3EHV5_PILCF|nr:hypothetical protein PILCRDRAFT_16352 [Piloderma croceum F 1598]
MPGYYADVILASPHGTAMSPTTAASAETLCAIWPLRYKRSLARNCWHAICGHASSMVGWFQ